MQFVQILSVVALGTGAVVAMPAHVEKRGWSGINRWWDRPGSDASVTVSGYAPQPTDWNVDASTTVVTAAPTTTTVAVVVSPTPPNQGNYYGQGGPQQSYSAPAQTLASAAPSASAASAPSSGGASGGQGDYMSVVSKWRSAGGLPAFTQDSTLEGNAMKTSTDSPKSMQHELNPGTLAQVLAPGHLSNFESVYVGAWLCEKPLSPGLNGICDTADIGWTHDGTKHAEILTSTTYTKIGCAIFDTIWACDLA